MGQKVLISFLGTGAKDDNRNYKKTTYKFNNGIEQYESFIAGALKNIYSIEKIILIGTVKSMWEEVYSSFSNNDKDEDYYIELGEYISNANHETPLVLPQIDKLEKSISDHSKVVLINYGLNEIEIRQNTEIILGIEQYLEPGDELYVDITHSFRSLPLMLMNSLIYLQNVSEKNISIKLITYGMLDVKGELGYAPVVELSNIMEINDWIIGAHSFKNYGNAYQIANLLNDYYDSDYKSTSDRLKKFSDLMNLNHLQGIKKQTELNALRNKTYKSKIPELILSPIIKQYTNEFVGDTTSKFQYKLANWHYEHMNYSSAYISLLEAIVSHVCENNKQATEIKDNRDEAKLALRGRSNNFTVSQAEINLYKSTNSIRNAIAHAIEQKLNSDNMISKLKENLDLFKKL